MSKGPQPSQLTFARGGESGSVCARAHVGEHMNFREEGHRGSASTLPGVTIMRRVNGAWRGRESGTAIFSVLALLVFLS